MKKKRYVYAVEFWFRNRDLGLEWVRAGYTDGHMFTSLEKAKKVHRIMVDRNNPNAMYEIVKYPLV